MPEHEQQPAPQPPEPSSERRPQPQYGELAPEGWVSPVASEANPAAGASPSGPSASGAPGPGERTSPAPSAHTPSRLPGVPHNLGAGGRSKASAPVGTRPAAPIAGSSQPTRASQPDGVSQPSPGEHASADETGPYRAAPPAGAAAAPQPAQPAQPAQPYVGVSQQPDAGQPSYGEQQHGDQQLSTQQPYVAQQPYASGAGYGHRQPASRSSDRIITIVLLALGAFGAFYFAASLYALPDSLRLVAAALGAEGFVVPSAVSTLATVGALTVLALYALNLVYSIQRMRAKKLAFWVPLVAGVIALIVSFTFMAFALFQAPELANLFSDPEGADKLRDFLLQM